MGTLTNSEDPDEMPHYFIRVYIVKVKTIIRDRNHINW